MDGIALSSSCLRRILAPTRVSTVCARGLFESVHPRKNPDTIGPPPLTVFLTFISCIDNYHSYTHLRLALGIVREPTVWGLLLQNTYWTRMKVKRAVSGGGPIALAINYSWVFWSPYLEDLVLVMA